MRGGRMAAAAGGRALQGGNASLVPEGGYGTGETIGVSSVDPATNTLGPLPDLYKVDTSAVTVGFLLLAAVLVLLMQLG